MNRVNYQLSYDGDLHAITLVDLMLETPEDVISFTDAMIAYYNQLPPKPYLLVDWGSGKLAPAAVQQYRLATQQLHKYVKATFRYGQPDVFTKLNVLAQTATNQYQTRFFASKKEALEALYQYAEAEKLKKD